MSPQPSDPNQTPMGSRRHRRHRLRGLDTPFGVILDVSESGACVFHKGSAQVNTGDELVLQVRHAGLELDLPARVVRTQKLGLKRLEVGIEFMSLSENQLAGVRALAAAEGVDFSPSVWIAA
ncbi:MAG: PilZ domain-containing protein [Planctomycetota bacterium]